MIVDTLVIIAILRREPDAAEIDEALITVEPVTLIQAAYRARLTAILAKDGIVRA